MLIYNLKRWIYNHFFVLLVNVDWFKQTGLSFILFYFFEVSMLPNRRNAKPWLETLQKNYTSFFFVFFYKSILSVSFLQSKLGPECTFVPNIFAFLKISIDSIGSSCLCSQCMCAMAVPS